MGATESYPGRPYFEILLTKFVNTVNLLFMTEAMIAIFLTKILTDFGFESYIRFILLIAICAFSIVLNHYHRYSVAKLNTIFAPFLLVFVFPLFSKQIYTGMFLWFPFGILIIGTISFFVFSYEKEKPFLDFVLTFFALAVLFIDLVMRKVVPPSTDLSFIYGENYFFYLIPKILLLIFLYSSLYFSKVNSFRNRQQLSRLNQELNDLNRDLENKVKERTAQLDQQNKRIKELTYANSHKVRACVARIIGLINLLYQESKEEEDPYYHTIKDTALELDHETKFVSEKLSEEY